MSEILTAQTLGRGLRLPFGAYTDWELLDTLEVLARERYEDLLRRARIINQASIDHRPRAAPRRNAQGGEVSVIETEPVVVSITTADGPPPELPDTEPASEGPSALREPTNKTRSQPHAVGVAGDREDDAWCTRRSRTAAATVVSSKRWPQSAMPRWWSGRWSRARSGG
ncbi:hypothetical protein [Baekduia sp.]|uniref:hypothetical protein n=1 Tax=Baekduia sp. TaxID=2600305 RepID=UPI002D1F9E08|nr:hypothetical protein [Baekduia sp.]